MAHLINIKIYNLHDATSINPNLRLTAFTNETDRTDWLLAEDLAQALGLFTVCFVSEQYPCWKGADGRVYVLLSRDILACSAYGPGEHTVAVVDKPFPYDNFAVHLDGDSERIMQMFTVAVRTAPESCGFSRLHADGDVLSVLWECEQKPGSAADWAWFDQEGHVVRHFVRDEEGAAESPWPGIPARRLAEREAPALA